MLSVSNTFDGQYGTNKMKKLAKISQFNPPKQNLTFNDSQSDASYMHTKTFIEFNRLSASEQNNQQFLNMFKQIINVQCPSCQKIHNMMERSMKTFLKICEQNQRKLINVDKICQIIKKEDYFQKNIIMQSLANSIKPIIDKFTQAIEDLQQNFEMKLIKIEKVYAGNYRLAKKSLQSKHRNEKAQFMRTESTLKKIIQDQQIFLNWHKEILYETLERNQQIELKLKNYQ